MLQVLSKNTLEAFYPLKNTIKRFLTYFLILNLVTQNFLYAMGPLLQVDFVDTCDAFTRQGIALAVNGDVIARIDPSLLPDNATSPTGVLHEKTLQISNIDYRLRIKKKNDDAYKMHLSGANFVLKTLFNASGNVSVTKLDALQTPLNLTTIADLALDGNDLKASILGLRGQTITNNAHLIFTQTLRLRAQSNAHDAISNNPNASMRLGANMIVEKGHMHQAGTLEIASGGTTVDLQGNNFFLPENSTIRASGSFELQDGGDIHLALDITLAQAGPQDPSLVPAHRSNGQAPENQDAESNPALEPGLIKIVGRTLTSQNKLCAPNITIAADLLQIEGPLEGSQSISLMASQKVNAATITTPHLHIISPEFNTTGAVDVDVLSGHVFNTMSNNGQFHFKESTLVIGRNTDVEQNQKGQLINGPLGHFSTENTFTLGKNISIENQGVMKAGKALFQEHTSILNDEGGVMSFGHTAFNGTNTFKNKGNFTTGHASGALEVFQNTGTSSITTPEHDSEDPYGWQLKIRSLINAGPLLGPGYLQVVDLENLGQMGDKNLTLDILTLGNNRGVLSLSSLIGPGHFINHSNLTLESLGIDSFKGKRGVLNGGDAQTITLLESLNSFNNDENAHVDVTNFVMEEKTQGAPEATLINKGSFKVTKAQLKGKVQHSGTFKADTIAWKGSLFELDELSDFELKKIGSFFGQVVSKTPLAFENVSLVFTHLVTKAAFSAEKAAAFIAMLLENSGAFSLKDTLNSKVYTLKNDANASATFDQTHKFEIKSGTNEGILTIKDSQNVEVKNLTNAAGATATFEDAFRLFLDHTSNTGTLNVKKGQYGYIDSLTNEVEGHPYRSSGRVPVNKSHK